MIDTQGDDGVGEERTGKSREQRGERGERGEERKKQNKKRGVEGVAVANGRRHALQGASSTGVRQKIIRAQAAGVIHVLYCSVY